MNLTFNRVTKNTILSHIQEKKCCKKAFLLGTLLFGQSFTYSNIRLVSENRQLIDFVCYLIEAHTGFSVMDDREEFTDQHKLDIKDAEKCAKILSSLGYTDPAKTYYIDKSVFKCDSCKKAFLQGVFLVGGNVSSPDKSYHLEISVAYFNLSRDLLYFLKGMSLEAKYTKRTSHYVLYYKESEKIIDFLHTVDATSEAFELCDKKAEKDMRNQYNRINNCEVANMAKQIASAGKQIEAIKRLVETGELEGLSDEMRVTATLRLENPQASLEQLAALHTPPVTKSCANRRLKKFLELAGY